MCGFAGWTGKERIEGGDARILRVMGRYLAPRGPDDETVLTRDAFRVVFRRLAINDVAGGKQPFVIDNGRFAAVVNGEIYNYRDLIRQHLSDVTLATRSDCEVVVHLYRKLGPRFLCALNGIYSIAIWDEREQTLLLARDRLGVKPLYYARIGENLVFGSELKAVLAHPHVPRTLDWAAFSHVPNSSFSFERPAGREVATGIEGVRFVAPATYLEWHADALRESVTYWNPGGPGVDVRSPEACVDEYAEILADSVRLQLLSDVPVGLFLSGGLDSALLAGIASRSTRELEAFTLVEPAITRTGDTAAAIELARHLEIPLHMVRVDEEAIRATVPLGLESLEYFVWIMDFPLFDVEFLFKHELHRYAKSVSPDMKVILLGQGADEFAGGYSRLGSDTWAAYADREARALRMSLLREQGIPSAYRRFFSGSVSGMLAKARAGDHEAWQFLRFGDLPAYNLWHEDRTAAANGMEARVPFLDHRLVELLCSIPEELRDDLFFDKAIERRAAHRFVPAAFAERPKVPLFRRGPVAEASIFALRRAFIGEAYAEYREKYLDAADALFAVDEMESLRNEAAVPRTGDAAVPLLLRCMAISIFDRLCRSVGHGSFEPPRLEAIASPLATGTLPAPADSALTPGSRIELHDTVRLALSWEDVPAMLVIQDGLLAAQIKLPPDCDWATVPRGLFAGRNVELADLSRAFGVDLEGMQPLADAFIDRGWGVLTTVTDGGRGSAGERGDY